MSTDTVSVKKQTGSSFFSRAFPLPRYLTMPAAGLDLSYQSIRCFDLVPNKNNTFSPWKTGRYGKISLPANTQHTDEPHLNEDLIKALRELKKQYGLYFVRASLPDEKSFIFRTTLPAMPRSEVRGVLETEIEQHIPLSSAEAIFEYHVLPAPSVVTTDLDVVVCAFSRKNIDEYILLYNSVGLVPISFHTEAEAITRSLIRSNDLGTYLVVHFGAVQTGICIVSDGVVQFTSTLNFGGKALTNAIEKQFSLSTAEAEEVKVGRRVLQNKQNMELFYSLMNPISALKDEISRILLYWKNYKIKNSSAKMVEKVLLCGSDATLPGIDEYLSISFKMPVEVGNVWANIYDVEKDLPPLAFNEALGYASAIGLALP